MYGLDAHLRWEEEMMEEYLTEDEENLLAEAAIRAFEFEGPQERYDRRRSLILSFGPANAAVYEVIDHILTGYDNAFFDFLVEEGDLPF